MSQSIDTNTTTDKPVEKKINKRDLAKKVFMTIKRRKSPKRCDFIAAFMAQCELTKNGAATYYYNFTSGPWSGKKKEPVAA